MSNQNVTNYLNNYLNSLTASSSPSQQKVVNSTVPSSYAAPKFNNSYSAYSSQAKYPVNSYQSSYSTQRVVPKQPLKQQKTAFSYGNAVNAQNKPVQYQQHFQPQQQKQEKKGLLAGSGLINASGSAFYDF